MAYPCAKGLGGVYQISMELIIPDRNISINEGAIIHYGQERETYCFEAAAECKVSFRQTIKELPQRSLNILL